MPFDYYLYVCIVSLANDHNNNKNNNNYEMTIHFAIFSFQTLSWPIKKKWNKIQVALSF